MDIKKIKEEFNKHYKKYDFNDLAILRKYYHSLRVMDLSRLIAKNNNFNDNDAEIAAIAGLLHDYSRFEQWTNYNTYNDLDSVDHGNLAVQRLFDENEICKYSLNKENYDEISDAIKYHNKLSIPNDLSEHNKLLCKVIRDADKLDILYLSIINKSLFPNNDDEISKKVQDAFFKNKSIKIEDVKSDNDKAILVLSYIFDINFKYSYQYIKDNDMIWKLFENINNRSRFIRYFVFAEKYIDERIDENVR